MKRLKLLPFLLVLLSVKNDVWAQSWQQVWSDEFNGSISNDWVFETGAGGWGNNELQYYRRENATVSNGNLVMTAKRESFGGSNYTSVRMKTQGKKSWKYGKIEARIAMPSFNGIWPAFWMLGDNISSVGWPKCGEIDIMEHVNAGTEVVGTIHWDDNGHKEYGGRTNTDNLNNFHTYAVEWNATEIKWLIDGRQYHVAATGGVNGTNEFQNNFFILLNLAVGGNWPGFNIDNNGFPTSMLVDYVRVFQLGSTPPPVSGGVSTVFKDCNYSGNPVNLPAGDYNYGALYARGIANEDISSITVNSGYEMVIYEHDNFTGASYVVGSNNSCLVAAGWNDRTTSLKVRAVTSSFSRTIQAESYSAMLGVQIEGTTDNGGGSNVGYIDNNDWMAYNAINFPTSGSYTVEYRVASMYGGNRISLDLNAGSIQLGSVNVPSTGGWQNWTTVSHTVNVNAGTYNMGLFASVGGFNLNWIRITKNGGARTGANSDNSTDASAVNNADVQEGFDLFPNPVENELNITSAFDLTGGYVKIIDVMGREVLMTSDNMSSINVSMLESGIYTLLAVTKDNNKVSKRFIKH